MLLSRLQGQHIRAAALVVHRFAGDAAGQGAHHLFLGGHKAQVRPAPAHGDAQRLAFPHGDVKAHLTRGFADAKGYGIDAHDGFSAGLVGQLCHLFRILKQAKEVGLLEVYAGGVSGQILKRAQIQHAVLLGKFLKGHIPAPAVGLDGVDDLRMRGGGDIDALAAAGLGHHDRLCRRRGAVIDGGVAHVHAGQFADHGLVFEDGLQHALADFRLIGRIGGDKFLLGGDRRHNGGDVVVIAAGAS